MTQHDYEARSRAAQAAAAQALERLLDIAETRDSGQVARVARVIASLYDGMNYPLDLFELRALDVALSDDILLCVDALRWGLADLYKLVPDGQRRMEAVIKSWGVAPPDPPMPNDWSNLNARLVTFGSAPGYRGVNLSFECRVLDASERGRMYRLRLSLDAADSAAVADQIISVHRFAWRTPGELPLDAISGEEPPVWAKERGV